MVLITSYKNTKDYVTSGSLYLFYNDKKFKDNNFILEDTRLHNGETIAPADPMFATEFEPDHSNSFVAGTQTNPLLNKKLAKTLQNA